MFDTVYEPVHAGQRQEALETPRWMLPLTHGVDMAAIECVVRLAESAGATLVAVSLISAPPEGARLEHIQQGKDFLEAVLHKAERFQVPLERYEVFTVDALQSLRTLVQERGCRGIVVVTSGERTHFLGSEEVKSLLTQPPAALVILRLSPPAGLTASSPRLAARFLSWLRGQWGWQDEEQEASPVEEPLWIRTEQHHLG